MQTENNPYTIYRRKIAEYPRPKALFAAAFFGVETRSERRLLNRLWKQSLNEAMANGNQDVAEALAA
jgi:hypothetical protein